MADLQLDIVRSAFDKMMGPVPGPLHRKLAAASLDSDSESVVEPADIFKRIDAPDPNDEVSRVVHSALIHWDSLQVIEWAKGTSKNTRERRIRIYELLELTPEQIKICNSKFPYGPGSESIVISEDWQGWYRWFPTRRMPREYYWEKYKKYLRDENKWEIPNLDNLERSTTDIVERLADPSAKAPYQCKGLVVGYVQSGKTANFTGVIAKAADAGYRLIIVLAGTIDILRDQTQRRIDRELVGVEMLGEDFEVYKHDDDAGKFLRHGGKPRALYHAFDWVRLTGLADYKRLRAGIGILGLTAHVASKPLSDPENLEKIDARLLVVKKNSSVLKNLIKDLKLAGKDSDLLGVPALIIDDESDQASINTKRRDKKEEKERTAINDSIVELMRTLPRCQYIGYTATPFANVFINPDDVEDLFPRDFIVSLQRPDGYMGVSDFFDDRKYADADYRSNRGAYVRFVDGEDGNPKNLPKAIDAFVLTGALKLYRHKSGLPEFRHHTMLVHHTSLTDPQKSHADAVRKLFEGANYVGGGAGLQRLRQLFDEDFSPVTSIRGADLPFPKDFNVLKPFIAECCQKITQNGKPVRIVNGKNKEDAPNFEKDRVWSIIVGGAKLSRGYTLEGLTISYYRRKAGAADTLMQMGRWFGFRRGYRDLVRLYIGNKEPVGSKGETIDLYEAFGAICRDEEEFRSQLDRYAKLDPGERLTPRRVPPLVSQHMLVPTAKNKMYNARVEFENFGGELKQPTIAPAAGDESRKQNARRMEELICTGKIETGSISFVFDGDGIRREFAAFAERLATKDVREYLEKYRWHAEYEKPAYTQAHGRVLDRVLDYLRGHRGNPEIDSWLLLAPQLVDPKDRWKADGHQFHVRERSRVGEGLRYNVYTEPEHVDAARFLAGIEPGSSPNRWTKSLLRPHQAVMLFYPVISEKEKKSGEKIPTMGSALIFPKNSIKAVLRWGVAVGSDDVTVPIKSK